MANDRYFEAYPDGLPTNRFQNPPPARTQYVAPNTKVGKPVDMPTGDPSLDEGIWCSMVADGHWRDARAFSERAAARADVQDASKEVAAVLEAFRQLPSIE